MEVLPCSADESNLNLPAVGNKFVKNSQSLIESLHANTFAYKYRVISDDWFQGILVLRYLQSSMAKVDRPINVHNVL